MKILIPVLSFGKAGGFRVLAELANRGNILGHEVTFVSPSKTKPYYKNEVEIIYIDRYGDVVSSFDVLEMNEGKALLVSLWRFLKKKSANYDAVIVNYHATAYPVIIGSKSVNLYYIQAYEPEFYDYTIPSIKNYLLKFLSWTTYFFPFTRIVNSNFYKNYKNIISDYIVEPGVDLNIFHPKCNTFANEEQITVGCIGRLEKWKGSDEVGKAIEILHQKGISVKLKVAFNKIDYPYHELEQPDGDINLANFYRSLDVLVASARIQIGAVHYPVIEAMACGTVVVTTGYAPADTTNSYIVPVNSPNAISQAIIEIMSNKSLAIKKAQKAQFDIRRFSWDVVTPKFYQILNDEMKLKNRLM